MYKEVYKKRQTEAPTVQDNLMIGIDPEESRTLQSVILPLSTGTSMCVAAHFEDILESLEFSYPDYLMGH